MALEFFESKSILKIKFYFFGVMFWCTPLGFDFGCRLNDNSHLHFEYCNRAINGWHNEGRKGLDQHAAEDRDRHGTCDVCSSAIGQQNGQKRDQCGDIVIRQGRTRFIPAS